jgi:hypothetical protein
MMSYFGTVSGPLWFWDIDDRPVADKWQTHPFERPEDWRTDESLEARKQLTQLAQKVRREGETEAAAINRCGPIMILDKERLQALEAAFEQFLDCLVEDFKIDDRAMLKAYVELAMRTYNHNPDKLSKDDLSLLIDLTPKVAGALRKNAIAIENIITNFDQQQVRGFEPEFCKSAYDQSEADALMTRIWRASDTLIELARLLSQHSTRGRSPDVGLHGALAVLEEYWGRKLGRKLKARPWKGDATRFIKTVFKEVIDPAAVSKLASAKKHRVKGLDKTTP